MSHLPRRRRRFSRVLGCALAAVSACLATPGTSWADPGTLTTDAGGSALVTAVQLSPGHVLERCVVVSTPTAYTAADLGLYVTAFGALADHLNVTIESGTGGSFADCTGFTGKLVFVGTLGALAAGFDAVRPDRVGHYSADLSAVTLRLRFSVQDDNSAQGLTTSAAFWWVPLTPAPVVVPPVAPTTVPPTPSATPPTSVAPTTTAAPLSEPGAPPTKQHTTTPTTTSKPVPQTTPSTIRPTLPDSETTTTPAPVATSLAPPVGVPLTGDGKTQAALPPVSGGGSDPPSGIVSQLATGIATGVAHAAQTISTAAAPALQGAAVTSLMILPLALLFLLVQRWFDRRDPKLALAPSYGDPFLGFIDRHRLNDRQGDAP